MRIANRALHVGVTHRTKEGRTGGQRDDQEILELVSLALGRRADCRVSLMTTSHRKTLR